MNPRSSKQHLVVIDALRGFAALWVFLYHIWNHFHFEYNSQLYPVDFPSNQTILFYVTFFLFQYGYYGVPIFFVVSGFCIHLAQARAHLEGDTKTLCVSEFLKRRFWRLYPTYFASLFVAAAALAYLRIDDYQARGWPMPLPNGFYWEVSGIVLLCCNAVFLTPWIESARDLNGVYWTLIFELQFYCLYPLLLWLMRRIGLVAVGVLLLTGELSLLPHVRNPESLSPSSPWEYFFLARYFEWYLGVLAAEIVVRRTKIPAINGLILLFLLSALYSLGCIFIPVLWPTRDLMVSVSTFLLLLLTLPTNSSQQPTSFPIKLLAWVGVFSFSLYLVHLPLVRLMFGAITFLCPGLDEQTRLVLLVPLVILGARAFYLVFEKPFVHGKQ